MGFTPVEQGQIAVAALVVQKPVNHRRKVGGEDFVACL